MPRRRDCSCVKGATIPPPASTILVAAVGHRQPRRGRRRHPREHEWRCRLARRERRAFRHERGSRHGGARGCSWRGYIGRRARPLASPKGVGSVRRWCETSVGRPGTSLPVPRTGSHVSRRPGALVDCCSEAVANRSSSGDLVPAWATRRVSGALTGLFDVRRLMVLCGPRQRGMLRSCLDRRAGRFSRQLR
jgi:hypothetical protein